VGTQNVITRLIQHILRVKFQNYHNPCPTSDIVKFANANGISHKGWDKPIEKYQSVNEFFTRQYSQLTVGPNPTALLAPSEGTVVGFTSMDIAHDIWIKQKHCSLQTMGIPSTYIHKMGERQIIQVYKLDVYDLHRYYAPVAGRIVARMDHLEPLRYSHSVRPVALKAGWDIMTENRRVILVIETNHKSKNDYVVMMIVGGIGVDSVDVVVKEGDQVQQGDTIGMFHMGGSAILIAASANNWQMRDDIEVASLLGVEVQTRIGDVIMRRT